MRKARYIRNIGNIDLDVEKDKIKGKAFAVLQVLCTTTSTMTDSNMSLECGMNLRTYKRWKNYLVMVGLLQVRQLNASTYVISIGEDAIDMDDKMNVTRDYKKMANKTFTEQDCTILIDSDTFYKKEEKEATFEDIDKYLQDNDIGYYGGRYGE